MNSIFKFIIIAVLFIHTDGISVLRMDETQQGKDKVNKAIVATLRTRIPFQHPMPFSWCEMNYFPVVQSSTPKFATVFDFN